MIFRIEVARPRRLTPTGLRRAASGEQWSSSSCLITRTTSVSSVYLCSCRDAHPADVHPENIVPLIVWHGAEMCVTMISIGIAVCRPLYGGWLDRLQPYLGTRSSSGSRSWRKGTGDNHHESEFAMRTIGGTPFGVQGDGRSRGRDEEEAEGLRPLGRKESGSDSGITHSKKWDMDVPQLQPSDETRSDTASRHEMITHNSSLLVGSQPSDSIAGSQEHLITRNDASPDYESSREIEAGKGPDFSIPLNELGVSRMRQTS